MKRFRQKLCIFIIAFLCFTNTIPSIAATSNAAKAKKAYRSWLNKVASDSAGAPLKYDIVDLDKNGIPDLFVTGIELYMGESRVYTYDAKKKKMVMITKCQLGKSHFGILYNKSKKMFIIISSDTGGWVNRFYKLKGKKAKRISTYEFRGEKHWINESKRVIKMKYFINRKKVKESVFNKKYKKAIKGFRELRHIINPYED